MHISMIHKLQPSTPKFIPTGLRVEAWFYKLWLSKAQELNLFHSTGPLDIN